MNHELMGLSRVVVQHGFQGQSLVRVQTHLVTDGLKAFVEVLKLDVSGIPMELDSGRVSASSLGA